MKRPTIVSRDEWTAARKRLLVKQKQFNRQRDGLRPGSIADTTLSVPSETFGRLPGWGGH